MAQEMNLWTRLSSESPKFFKRIITLALTIAGIATSILTLVTAGTISLPKIIVDILGYAITAGVIAAAVAKTTMTDVGVANAKIEKEAEVAVDKIKADAEVAKDKIEAAANKTTV